MAISSCPSKNGDLYALNGTMLYDDGDEGNVSHLQSERWKFPSRYSAATQKPTTLSRRSQRKLRTVLRKAESIEVKSNTMFHSKMDITGSNFLTLQDKC